MRKLGAALTALNISFVFAFLTVEKEAVLVASNKSDSPKCVLGYAIAPVYAVCYSIALVEDHFDLKVVSDQELRLRMGR